MNADQKIKSGKRKMDSEPSRPFVINTNHTNTKRFVNSFMQINKQLIAKSPLDEEKIKNLTAQNTILTEEVQQLKGQIQQTNERYFPVVFRNAPHDINSLFLVNKGLLLYYPNCCPQTIRMKTSLTILNEFLPEITKLALNGDPSIWFSFANYIKQNDNFKHTERTNEGQNIKLKKIRSKTKFNARMVNCGHRNDIRSVENSAMQINDQLIAKSQRDEQRIEKLTAQNTILTAEVEKLREQLQQTNERYQKELSRNAQYDSISVSLTIEEQLSRFPDCCPQTTEMKNRWIAEQGVYREIIRGAENEGSPEARYLREVWIITQPVPPHGTSHVTLGEYIQKGLQDPTLSEEARMILNAAKNIINN